MKIALIEAPTGYLPYCSWEDVYFPETPFPISEFLTNEQSQLRIWDLYHGTSERDPQKLLQELQAYQPVVIGINDHQTTNGLVLERLIKQVFPRALVFYSPDQMTIESLLDKANQSAFSLRQSTKPMAGKIRLRRTWEDDELFAVLPEAEQREQARQLEAEYLKRYQLGDWKQNLPEQAYRRNLYMLEILEDVLTADLPLWNQEVIRVLDVGPGDWVYAPGVYQFFRHAYTDHPRKVYLTGVELDPYRIDREGCSRVDYALSYVDAIASYCRYLIQDFLEYQPKDPVDVALQMLPLVLPEAHLFWGLPLKYFQPEAVLRRILALLRPAGYLVVANEIRAEYEFQKSMFDKVGVNLMISGTFFSCIRQSYMGFLSCVQKSDSPQE